MTPQLPDRDREIFRILVADYIATADPVGSRTIARKHPGHLSPATIRNVMSDLTEMGLIEQPHTSAGRIPTDDGFRYYVNCLLTRRDLSPEEMVGIRERCLGDERGTDVVLQRASRMLAAVSRYVGLVVTPSADKLLFKRIEFLPLSRQKILGILVTQDGQVENRLIEAGTELNFSELERIANYCNQAFAGLSLDEALEKTRRELESQRSDYDLILRKAMLFSEALLSDASHAELVIDGQTQLLGEPEFSGAKQVKELLEALEEKQAILKMLERCRDAEGVRVFIGTDAAVGDSGGMGCVGAPYFRDGKAVGTLGVIGPKRMDYSHVVPIVDFTAKLISDALEGYSR